MGARNRQVHTGVGRRFFGTLCCGLAATLLLAIPASGKVVELIKYNGVYPAGSFDGSGSVGGPAPFSNNVRQMDVNQVTGQVIVGSVTSIYQFSSSGSAEVFEALAPNSAFSESLSTYGDLAIDNSGGTGGPNEGEQGRIYALSTFGASVTARKPNGESLGGNFPLGYGQSCGIAVAPDGNLWIASYGGAGKVEEFTPSGDPTGTSFNAGFGVCGLAIDSVGNFYVIDELGPVVKFNSAGETQGVFDPDTGTGEPNDVVVDRSNDRVYVEHQTFINEYEPGGTLLNTFGKAEDSYPGLLTSQGLAINETSDVIYAANNRTPNRRVDTFAPTGPITIPDVTTGGATAVTSTSATLHGVVNPDGIHTTDCQFEYGIGDAFDLSAPCEVGGVPTSVFSGSADQAVSAAVEGLVKGATYKVRLTAVNANEVVSRSNDSSFTASDPPFAYNHHATAINTDSAQLNADVDPAGGLTTYRFEWGTSEGVYDHAAPIPDAELSTNSEPQRVSVVASGLAPGTTYYYRVVAHNDAGGFTGGGHIFTTFAPPSGEDPCDNAFVRQQTGAALLLDCRAYELVSAEDTGGYNVESDIVRGQRPFEGYPRAGSRALYGVHDGAIPGPWNPTNRGVDPYVASRGENGWTTDYVGIPADLAEGGPYSSPLAGADERLDKFAFAGEGICEPCFDDGASNVPLRQPDGIVIKGMAGSLEPPADPAGEIVKPFSADGSHFLFGSTAQFEGDANSNGTDATIYDRDLGDDTTQVVSKLPNGNTIANGDGVAALDISSDGSRIVIGQLVSTDAKGNDYYRLYMHIGNAESTIELTPGANGGAIYNGMTSDGTRVYFTTRDPLTTSADHDTDTSADVYRADVAGGSATLTRVSAQPGAGSGGAGDTDTCEPPGTSTNVHWNTVDAATDCSAAAIAGGGGVATESGDLYFFSPELLDTSDPENLPVQDAPNLYLSTPGEPLRFVATLESKVDQLPPELKLHTESGSFGSFTNATGIALAPDGDLYVFDIGDDPRQIERYTPGGTLESVISGGLEQGPNRRPDIPSQIAVDPVTGDLYVPIASNSGLNQNRRYSDSGVFLNTLSSTFLSSAVAVNPLDRNVFLGNDVPTNGNIDIRTPTNGAVGSFPAVTYVRGIAIDSTGRVYVAGKVQTALYSPSGQFIRTVVPGQAYGVAVDPENDDVFVDQGNRVLHFSASGELAGTVEVGGVTTGRSIVVGENHRLYLIEGGNDGQVRWYDEQPAPDLRTDNPAVVHAVNDAGTRHTEDLQVTPDGDFALFSSTLPLTGFNNLRRSEIYRYAVNSGRIDCPSCPPTNGAPTTDTTLAPAGLNLVDDGMVFFTTAEPLVLRDSNDRRDAYEWKGGAVELISPGLSPHDSTLLSVSADGTDAYFFTRDTLVRQDRNRTLVKIYDARAGGGFLFIPPPVPCRASDECHGPGSAAPPPLGIPTITGSRGNQSLRKRPRCRRGKVRKRGRCVRRRHRGARRGVKRRRGKKSRSARGSWTRRQGR